ncbi:transmembrane protein 91-like isoform X2 [Argopecten irradians]
MSAPLYQRFDNDGEPPLFLISGPLPQHEQTYMPNRAADMATIDIVHQPQNADPEMSAPDAPKDYMTLSIITCLFCAWPVGLCAVCAAFDTQTNNLKGDVEGARSSSRMALQLNIISFVVGICVYTFIILYIFGFLSF